MFFKSYSKSEVRPFDHLYDPLYATGNIKDIQRKNVIVLERMGLIDIFTNYGSMFSESSKRTIPVLRQNILPIEPAYHGKV